MKKVMSILVAFTLAFALAGCSDAVIASQNMSKATDQFVASTKK